MPTAAHSYAAADLMTSPVTSLRPEDTLDVAAALFQRERIRHLPVLRAGRLVGIVTERDLQRSCQGREPQAVRAHEAMTTELQTVQPNTPLRRAAELMLTMKIGSVPVVDDEGQLLGLLTESDFVRFALDLITDFDKAADGLERQRRSAEA